MEPRVWLLVLSILSTLLAQGNQCVTNAVNSQRIQWAVTQDSSEWSTGFAMTPCGRIFSCYPASIDPLNTNDGYNGKYAVAKLTDCGEIPYPNLCINNPEGGVINYSTCPPTAKGLRHHFISVQTIVYIKELNLLFCLDTDRARDCKQILYQASSGGTKVVAINVCNNCVSRIYYFDENIAKPTSYIRGLVVDPKKNVAYIVDGLGLFQVRCKVIGRIITGPCNDSAHGAESIFPSPKFHW